MLSMQNVVQQYKNYIKIPKGAAIYNTLIIKGHDNNTLSVTGMTYIVKHVHITENWIVHLMLHFANLNQHCMDQQSDQHGDNSRYKYIFLFSYYAL